MNLYRRQEVVPQNGRGRRGELRQHGVDFILQRVYLRAGIVELQRVGLRFYPGDQKRPQRRLPVVGQIALAAHIVVVRRTRAGGKLWIRQAVVAAHRAVGQRKVAAKAVPAVVHVRVDVRPFAVEQGHVPRAAFRFHASAFQPGGIHQCLQGQRVARRVRASHDEGRMRRAVRAGIHIGDQSVVEPERARIVPAQPLAVQRGNPLKHSLIQLRRLLRREGVFHGIRDRFVGLLRRRVVRRFAGILRRCVLRRFAGILRRRVPGRFAGLLRGRVFRRFAGILRGRVFRRFAGILRGRFPPDFRLRLNLDDLRRGNFDRRFLRKRRQAAQQHRQTQKRGQYAQVCLFHLF